MRIDQHYKAALEQQIAFDATADQDGLRGDTQHIALEMESAALEMQRLHDVADALQDAVLSVEGLREADPHHLMLFEACLNLSQAGTLNTADTVVPSLETYLGSTIATESVVQNIKNLLQAIQRLMRRLWHFIADFFVSIANEVGRARLRMTYVRTLVSEIDGKQAVRDHVALGNTAYAVCAEHGVPHDAHAIIVSLTEMLNQTKALRTHLVPILLSIGESLVKALPQWPNDPEKNRAWLANLNQIASAYQPHAVAQAVGQAYHAHNPQLAAGASLVAAPLPGSRSLTFTSGELAVPDKADGDEMARANVLQANSITLIRQRQAHNIDLSKATMAVMNNNELNQILDIVDRVLDEVETGVREGLKSRLQRLGRQLEESAAKIDSSTDADTTRLRKGLRYASVYTGWVNSPYIQLMAHDMMVCRMMTVLVSHHCAAYHK